MKKLVIKVAVLMMTAGYSVAAGTIEKEKPESATSRVEVVATAKSAVYKLSYASESVGTVKVNIYDAKGDLLYTDLIRSAKSFQKMYDFSQLGSGNFRIEVAGAEGKIEKTIQIASVKESLIASVSTLDTKGKYELQVRNKEMKPVFVSIYDASDNLLYEDQIDVNHNFSRVYDFSRNYAKAASFVVSSDGATITQVIR
jgi:hypothetical protein